MENNSNYQKRGVWVMILGLGVATSVLLHLEMSRAKPSVEYIGLEQSEPTNRVPGSFPASPPRQSQRN